MRRHGIRKTKTDIQATGELNYAKEDAFTPAQFPSSTQSLPPSSLIPVLPLILFSVSLCLLLIFEFSHRVFFLVLPFSFSICRILLLPLFDMEGNSLNFEPHLEVEGIGNLETRVSNSLPVNFCPLYSSIKFWIECLFPLLGCVFLHYWFDLNDFRFLFSL